MTFEFSEVLKEYRDLQGITQKKLADKLGCPVSRISFYEVGSKKPSLETIKDIAIKLDISSDYLLGLKRTMEKRPDGFRGEKRLSANQWRIVQHLVDRFVGDYGEDY